METIDHLFRFKKFKGARAEVLEIVDRAELRRFLKDHTNVTVVNEYKEYRRYVGIYAAAAACARTVLHAADRQLAKALGSMDAKYGKDKEAYEFSSSKDIGGPVSMRGVKRNKGVREARVQKAFDELVASEEYDTLEDDQVEGVLNYIDHRARESVERLEAELVQSWGNPDNYEWGDKEKPDALTHIESKLEEVNAQIKALQEDRKRLEVGRLTINKQEAHDVVDANTTGEGHLAGVPEDVIDKIHAAIRNTLPPNRLVFGA